MKSVAELNQHQSVAFYYYRDNKIESDRQKIKCNILEMDSHIWLYKVLNNILSAKHLEMSS